MHRAASTDPTTQDPSMPNPHTSSATELDLDRAAHDRNHALAAYQQALADFDRDDPPPPCTWATWPQAKQRNKRRRTALAPHLDRLAQARNRYRDLLCLHLDRPPT